MQKIYTEPSRSMTKRKRKFLFYVFASVFFISAPLVILYAIGFTPDITKRSLLKTGGIFVKSKTGGLKVILNKELRKETSYISGGAILPNLLPGTYILRLEKDSHRPWYKSVEVVPTVVTELRSILMLPESLTPEKVSAVATSSIPISLSPDGNLLLSERVGTTTQKMSLFDLTSKKSFPIKTDLTEKNIPKILKTRWQNDNSRILIKRDSEKNPWSLISKSEAGLYEEKPIQSPNYQATVLDANFNDKTQAKTILTLDSTGTIYTSDNGTTTRLRENINSFSIYNQEIFFIDKNGFLAKMNIETKDTKIINRPGFFLSEESAEIIFSPLGDLAIIDKSGGLFFVSGKEEDIIRPITGEVKGVEFDSLGKKILFWKENEIGIMWAEQNSYQPFQKEFIKELIFRVNAVIQAARWFTKDDAHIFIKAGDALYLTEIDGRGGRNTLELLNKIDQFFWSASDNTLYSSNQFGFHSLSF